MSQNRKFQLNELPQEIKFSLVFDEDIEGEELKKALSKNIPEEDEIDSDQEDELAEDDED